MSLPVARRYFVRGRAALIRGDLDDAAADLRAAVELAPGFVEARIAYAAIIARADAARAAQSLRAGLTRARRAEERRRLLEALAEVLLAQGDYAAVRAVLAEPELVEAGSRHLADLRARLLAKTGSYRDAFDALARAAGA